MALTDTQAKNTKKKKSSFVEDYEKRKAVRDLPSPTTGAELSTKSPIKTVGQTKANQPTVKKSSPAARKRAAQSREKGRALQAERDELNAKQTLSGADKKLSVSDQLKVRDAKTAWDQAKAAGDAAGMEAAHKRAETVRKRYGYSGGGAGDEYISPELSAQELSMLNTLGRQRLKSARMTLEAAQKVGDENAIARAEETISRILELPAYRQPAYQNDFGKTDLLTALARGELGKQEAAELRKAPQRDSEGRTIFSRSEEERERAGEQFLSGLEAAGKGFAGSLLSVSETFNQAMRNYQRERWGGIQKGPAQPDGVTRALMDQETTGQRLMRESREAQQKATEGLTGVEALLAAAGISSAQALPGIAASFIPGVGPALGLGLMGAQATGAKANELTERGVSAGDALTRGLVSGGIEVLTERLPVKSLLDIVRKSGGANFLVDVAKQAGLEAKEESASYILNCVADLVNQDPEARFSLAEMAESAAVGAISGAGFAAGGSAVGSAIGKKQTKTGQDILLEAAGIKPRETAQNEQEQVLEEAQQPTPETAETPVQGQERGETARQALERRHADVMSRIQAAKQDGSVNDPAVYEGFKQELQAINQEEAQLVQAERQEAGQVSHNFGQTESHIDNRTAEDVSARNVKAFQFDHPQLHQYFAEVAQALKTDAEFSLASQRYAKGEGTVVMRSEQLAQAEGMGLTRQEIIQVCNDIIADKGQENYAAAKKVELILDEMLSKGYLPNGNPFSLRVDSNQDYIQAKEAIPGAVTGFDQYLRENSLALELGETTEEELRAEFEARSPIQADTSLFDRSILQNLNQARTSFIDFARRFFPSEVQNANTGKTIKISRKGIDKFLSGRIPYAKYATGFHIPELVERAVLTGRASDRKNRESVLGHEYYESPIQVDGTPYMAYIRVRNTTSGDSYYGHTIGEIEEIKIEPSARTDVQGTSGPVNAIDDSTYNIAESPESSNPEFEAMGAMSRGGAGAFASWQAETPGEQFHPINEQAAQVTAEQRGRAQTEIPQYNLQGRLTSKTISTFANANILPNEMVTAVGSDLSYGAYSRIAYTDAQALADAEAIIEREGYQGAKEYWLTETAGGRINKANSVLGIALINRAANSPSLHVDAMDLLSRYADYAKDAGQALQAMNMINKLTPQGQLYTMVKAIEYMEQRAAKNGQAVNVELNPELVTAFMQAETQQERNEIKQEMIKDAAAQLPATWRDRFDSWRYLSMLGNARTHARNVLGNAGFAVVRGVKNVTAAGLERAVGVQDRQTSVLNRFDAEDRARLAIANGEFPQVKELILSGGKYMDEYSQLNQKRDVWKFDNKVATTLFKPVSWLSEKNSELLDKGDVWFSRPAYAAALARHLKANNITAQEYGNMLEGDTRRQEAQAHAIKEAQKATYRDTNAFSEAISQISKARHSDNKVIRHMGYLAEGVLPFKKTPANILVRGVEYSPIGLLKGVGDAVVTNRAEAWSNKGEGKNFISKWIIKNEKELAGNAKTPAEAIDEIAAGLTGTGLLGLGVALGYLGIAVGGATGDEEEDDFRELQGHQNYAIEIGNRSITLDWLAPEALPFFVGIELQKFIQQKMEGEATADDLISSLLRIADPMLEMSMLQGLNDLFTSFGSDYALSSAAWTAATSYLTQFLPTLAGQIERVGEPVRETTFVDPNSNVPKGLQYLLGNVGNKIPGWDYNQVDYVDAWGRTEDQGDLVTRLFNNLLNPAYTSQINAGSTEAELMRLYDAGYDSVLPSSFQKSAKINGEKVSASQWFNMQTERGQTAKSVLDSFIGTEQYASLTDDEKAKFVKKVLEYGADRGKVKGGADAEETFSRWQEAAQNAKEAVGLDEAEIIASSAYLSVLDNTLGDETKASIKQGQFEQWVDSNPNWNDEQKAFVKDNIKLYTMVPANSGKYHNVVDAGYDGKRAEELLMARSEYADSNNGLYEFILSQASDYAEQEKLFNAFKDKGTTKTWAELSKEQAPVSSRIKTAKANVDSVMDADRQTAFADAVSEFGTNSRYAVYQGLMSIDATDEERRVYYEYIKSQRTSPWKASWAQMKANSGYP